MATDSRSKINFKIKKNLRITDVPNKDDQIVKQSLHNIHRKERNLDNNDFSLQNKYDEIIGVTFYKNSKKNKIIKFYNAYYLWLEYLYENQSYNFNGEHKW
jgi:hypothetical protein